MATRDTSPGSPTLGDHVVRLADLSDTAFMSGLIDLGTSSDHRGAPYSATANDFGRALWLDDALTLPVVAATDVGRRIDVLSFSLSTLAVSAGAGVTITNNAPIPITGVASLYCTIADGVNSTYRMVVGSASAGVGDMLKSENLAGLSSYLAARINLNVDVANTDNSDNNAPNTLYAADYRLANFIAGTHYEPAKGVDDNFVTAAQTIIIGNTSGTNTGDQTIPTTGVDFDPVATDNSNNNAPNTLYAGLVSNVTHTGDVTGSTALTIAAKAVDVAMLADGVDGELITWSATGVATTIPVGTVAHVLTSNGLGAAPTFQAVGAASEVNDLTASVTWANVPDGFITASSVTQHTAAVVTTLAVTTAGALMDSEVDADLKTLALPASTTISAFGATLVDDASNTAARATLGVSIGSQVQAYNVALTGTTGTYTSANATKLSGIATAATANSTNAVLLARANHTGTQTLATISDVPANPIASKSIWSGTQTAYDLLTPDANTLYLITA